MADQLCMCGTQPGYVHKSWCPYPLYNAAVGSDSEKRWNDHAELSKAANALEAAGVDLASAASDFSHTFDAREHAKDLIQDARVAKAAARSARRHLQKGPNS